MKVLTDSEINELIIEKKPLPLLWIAWLKPRLSRNCDFKECELDVISDENNKFKIIVKENPNDKRDFSVMLIYKDSMTNRKFRLIRFNGPSHKHTNTIEKRRGVPDSMYDEKCHIHICTERYQLEGLKEDHYAEPTERFKNMDEALRCLEADCGFYHAGNGN